VRFPQSRQRLMKLEEIHSRAGSEKVNSEIKELAESQG
jgi:hypothetical protein